jgi:uncharacterized membrane protein
MYSEEPHRPASSGSCRPRATGSLSRPAAVLIGALASIGLVAYALIAHWLTISDDRSLRGYGFALGSIWLIVVAAGWASRWRWPVLVGATLAALTAWVAHQHTAWDPRWIYLIQHAGTNLWLGLLFGGTLRAGREPLVTKLATLVHGDLPPAIRLYTRKVTIAWAAYFAAMAGASLLLFFGGWAWWWSVLANFVTAPSVLLMFVVEYIVRRRSHPGFQHAGFFESFRLFGRRS